MNTGEVGFRAVRKILVISSLAFFLVCGLGGCGADVATRPGSDSPLAVEQATSITATPTPPVLAWNQEDSPSTGAESKGVLTLLAFVLAAMLVAVGLIAWRQP